MILAKVVGNVVSTIKHQDYERYKILVVQPIDAAHKPVGKSFLAVDGAQAGIGETVLVVDEGGAGRGMLGASEARTLRTVVFGIVDEISLV